jgi:hypothetical protein
MPNRRKPSDEGTRTLTVEHLGFVGIGRSVQGALSPVSERHDEALGEPPALRLQSSKTMHGAKE